MRRLVEALPGRATSVTLWAAALLLVPFPSQLRAQMGSSEAFFPQVAFGAGSRTEFFVHNPNNAAITVNLRIFSSGAVSQEFEVLTLGPGATESLVFGPGQSDLIVGWAFLDSEANFMATEFFDLFVAGRRLPKVGVLPCRASIDSRFFGFVGIERNSGLALVNPRGSPTELTIRLFGLDGSVRGTAIFDLGPFEHLAVFLNQLPALSSLTSFQGTVSVTADQEVNLANLNQDSQGNLSTVAVFHLDP